MASSAYSTSFPPVVYWQIWRVPGELPIFKVQLVTAQGAIYPVYTYYTLYDACWHVLWWHTPYTVETDEVLGPVLGASVALYLADFGIPAFSWLPPDIDPSPPTFLP